ncbi:MAG: pyridoxal-phosphate dependent enzyme [Thermoplasmata archaeon]
MINKTTLHRAMNLEKLLKINNIYLKFEGTNPTGTQKDRISILHVDRAINEGYNTITVATCGNYGSSIAYFAYLKNLKAVIYIPRQYHTLRIQEMEKKYNAKVVLVDGKYEDAVAESKKNAKNRGWFDANAGEHPDLNRDGYEKIAIEIFEDLNSAPSTVSVPVGNGTTISGIYQGFENLYNAGKISNIPRMIAASTDGGNPIIESFNNHQDEITDLDPRKIKETEINEPLVNYHAYDGELALKALINSNGFAEYVSDQEMEHYSKLIKDYENLDVLPASTASLAALIKILKKNVITGAHVIILTGKKIE